MTKKRNDGLKDPCGLARMAAIGLLALTASLALADEDLSAWQKRMPIAFDGYTPPDGGETLTNFPVLVVLSNTTAGVGFNYDDFQSPPYGDLRFAAADKTTPLDFEVESWDTNGLSHVWVRAPELTADATIYALWGKNGAVEPPCATNGDVWTDRFAGVWHLGATNSQVGWDSTSNRNNGIANGSVTPGAIGQTAGGVLFGGGSSDYIECGNDASLSPTGQMTISLWAKTADTKAAMVSKYNSASPYNGYLFGLGPNTADGKPYYWTGNNLYVNAPTVVSDGAWHHLAAVHGGTTCTFYVDGKISAVINAGTRTSTSTRNLRLGGDWDLRCCQGILDEIRISNAARSPNWMWACFMNTASNDLFNAYGEPESQDLPLVSNAGGASNVTSTAAWLNGTLGSTGASATAVFVFSGAMDGGANLGDWARTNLWLAPQLPGSFTANVTGLSSDTTYYYRFAASNESGWAWASPASVFITGDVWIEKTSDASELGPTPGTFTVFRASAATNEPLTVAYTVGGTALNGTDFSLLSGTVTIPAGESSATMEVLPVFDHLVEGTETVDVTLMPGPHAMGAASNATVEIADYGLVTRTWGGAGTDAFASNPTNWVEGEAPIAGDAIVLDDRTNKNLTWNLAIPVQSWTQDGYTGAVTVATVYPGQGAFTNLAILGDCVISNGMWTHTANTTAEAYRLRVSVGGALTVGPDGAIDATGKGYNATGYRGPGGGASGGYGGRAQIPWNIAQEGYCYGSIMAPTNIGSAGGTSGGGAIHLTVSGVIRHDGLIRADGAGAIHYNGSGGGIYLVAGGMSGQGAIQAHGGTCGTDNGGGGGRISLVVTNAGSDFLSYTGLVRALPGGLKAGTGTAYFETAADGAGRGTVVIDAGGGSGRHYTEINPNVAEKVLANVLIRNQGHLSVVANHELEISGIWSNAALFTAQAGSRVVFSDRYTAASTLYGSTTFLKLVMTNEAETVRFAPGSTTAIASGGELVLRGSATETNLFLRSLIPGQAWKLNVNGAAAQSIWNVDVADSDASSGAQVTALISRDSGSNTNWAFSDFPPGITNVWTGAASTLWNVGANWHSGRAPYEDDFIRIPSGLSTYPVINAIGRTVAGLVIEAGASLSLNGYNLTVTGDAAITGALTCAGGEIVTFRGDVDFTGGACTPASSRIVLAGLQPQRVVWDGLTFHTIAVSNAQTVTFADGFTAHELIGEPPAGETRSLVFAKGATVALNILTLLSAPALTNITLRSSQDGRPWSLAVLYSHSVRGVDVKDSHADSGQTLYASGSRDGGGNANWNFNQNWSEWTGSTGNGLFSDAANWWPAAVPGEAAWVRVENNRPMTIASPVTLRNLLLGGGTPTAQVTANAALTVVETIRIMGNGILTLNRPSVVGSNLVVGAGGTLTHTGNDASEVNKLNVTVAGNVRVDTNGSVTATAKGFATGKGYGGKGGVIGGSYGGRGGASSGPCYGSVIAPTNLGSGGGYAGAGGAIQLSVSGELRHDGVISADGTANVYPSGSGGSIWLTAGTMRGNGVIRGNGATAGGGGRIALVVTNAGADFADLILTPTANGGGGSYGFGGAGTVYMQHSGDRPGRGTVRMSNNGQAAYSDVPPAAPNVPGEVTHAVFHVLNAARLRLTNDFTVGDIWLDTANAWLDLGSNTLTVHAREHTLSPGIVTNRGDIIWMGLPPGALILIK